MKLETFGRTVRTIILVATTMLVWYGLARADTNGPTFFDSTAAYFTSFDTNKTMTSQYGIQLSTGADYQDGLNFANEIDVRKVFIKAPATGTSPASGSGLAIDAQFRNAGIAGTLVDAKAGVGWSFTHYDAQATAYIDGGYRLDTSNPELCVGADVRKCLTENTYAGVGIEYDQSFGAGGRSPHAPVARLFTGFKF